MLLQLGRLEDAARELRGALVDDPDDPTAHALLAVTLGDLGETADAESEGREAVRLAPDSAFALRCLASVLLGARRLDEALRAANAAVEQDAGSANGFLILAQVLLAQARPDEALEAVETSLALDPADTDAANVRSVILLALNRRDEAASQSEATLADAPESAVAHNVRGWALLHESRPDEALGHFREALRLDPTLDNARQGLVLALKARHRLYAGVLRYFLWLERLSPRRRKAVSYGFLPALWLLSAASHVSRAFGIAAAIFVVAYLLLVVATWFADPLFNLVLRFDRDGRLALAPRERLSANLLACCLGAGLVCLVGAAALQRGVLLGAALACCLLAIPLSVFGGAASGWPRLLSVVVLTTLAALALAAAAWAFAVSGGDTADTLIALAVVGCVASTWLRVLLPRERRPARRRR